MKKTGDRIRLQLKFHCLSCNLCQRTFPNGRVTKVPLEKITLIETTPFKRVEIDIVGPIQLVTEKNKRNILTLMDYATRYPEAVPLSSIDADFGTFCWVE